VLPLNRGTEYWSGARAGLLAQALTNRQIAVQLVLSERTVESHVRNILAKTQCANRTEFVARWKTKP
jgi:DNA-binding NarL/FixJ family response regulator